jgi:hypothetical protein
MIYDAVKQLLIVIAFIIAMTFGLMVFCRDSTHFKGLNRRDDANMYQAFFDRFYFILVTISTMGYGDIAPATNRAKVSVIVILLFVIVIILNTFSNMVTGYDKYIKNILTNLVQSSKQINSVITKHQLQ